jgi:enterochelin esterase family protein
MEVTLRMRRLGRLLPAVAPLLFLALTAEGQASVPGIEDTGVSPRIERLKRDIAAGGTAAVNEFWTEVAQAGTPLIEAVPGDDRKTLVTFLWRGVPDTKSVLVTLRFAQARLKHLGTTDVWHTTFTIASDYRLAYALGPTNGENAAALRTDPLNRGTPLDMGAPVPLSVVELPRAKRVPWVAKNPAGSAGRLEERTIDSRILENEPHRKITVYTPPGYDARAAAIGAVIFMDDFDYLRGIGAPTILDNLITAKQIPPVIGVFISHSSAASAAEDLDNHQVFVDFLAKELMPWLHQGWNVTSDPSRLILCGASRGGLGAAYAAYRRPDLFGNVLAESPALWRGNEGVNEPHEWLTRQMAAAPKLPIRFFISVGTLETGLTPTDDGRGEPTFIDANRHFKTMLQERRYDVDYHETPGGHEPLHWRSVLPDGLMYLARRP